MGWADPAGPGSPRVSACRAEPRCEGGPVPGLAGLRRHLPALPGSIATSRPPGAGTPGPAVSSRLPSCPGSSLLQGSHERFSPPGGLLR